MPAQDLTTARALAGSDRLASPAEYQREILRALLVLVDARAPTELPAEPPPPPAAPRRK